MPEKEKIEISYYGNSDIGLVRKDNQDSFGIFPSGDPSVYSGKGILFIIADGMGGHAGGKEASSLAVNVIKNVFLNSTSSDLELVLKEALEEANSQIFNKSENSKELKGMGTTCSALILKENKGFISHIGDSKIYLIESDYVKKNIEQLTEDHTKVHEMVKQGILTEKEAEVYPSKSVLMRALGVDPKVNADFKEIKIKAGQNFVLCSDGLANVTKEEIINIVERNSPEIACSQLIKLANERGGGDNVSVIVVKLNSSNVSKAIKPSLPPKKKKNFTFLIILIFIVTILGVTIGILFGNYSLDSVKRENKGSELNKNDAPQPKSRVSDDKNKDESDVLRNADRLYEEGKLENALAVYKKILMKKPMHLGALQGVNNIAAAYEKEANKYQNNNKFEEALKFYKKALEIQPSNTRLKQIIKDLEIKLGM
jgi:protein phosphatase